jgi:hypothetical protein
MKYATQFFWNYSRRISFLDGKGFQIREKCKFYICVQPGEISYVSNIHLYEYNKTWFITMYVRKI